MRIRCVLPILLAGATLATSAFAQDAEPRGGLTVERVASLPSLIGTPPASPAWSPNSEWLAFRWNDAGWPFRDVYVVAAGEKFELLATNPMGEVLMATPAAAPGRLFIRGQHHLFSIRDAAPADEKESPVPR